MVDGTLYLTLGDNMRYCGVHNMDVFSYYFAPLGDRENEQYNMHTSKGGYC